MKLSKKVLSSVVVCLCLGTLSGFSYASPGDSSRSSEEVAPLSSISYGESNHQGRLQIPPWRYKSTEDVTVFFRNGGMYDILVQNGERGEITCLLQNVPWGIAQSWMNKKNVRFVYPNGPYTTIKTYYLDHTNRIDLFTANFDTGEIITNETNICDLLDRLFGTCEE